MTKKGVDVPSTLPQVFDNYIRNKTPPFADLDSLPDRSTGSTGGDANSVRLLEDAYNKANASTNTSVQSYREQNQRLLENERSEVSIF